MSEYSGGFKEKCSNTNVAGFSPVSRTANVVADYLRYGSGDRDRWCLPPVLYRHHGIGIFHHRQKLIGAGNCEFDLQTPQTCINEVDATGFIYKHRPYPRVCPVTVKRHKLSTHAWLRCHKRVLCHRGLPEYSHEFRLPV